MSVSLCHLLIRGLVTILFMSAPPLHAERIAADMSDRVIKIASNFTGSRIVVFGMIERDGRTVSRAEPYDLVITVRGWDQTLVSRRKQRVVGVWVNKERRFFTQAPNFYALSSNRKLEDIASPKVLTKLQLGTDYLLLPPGAENMAEFATYDPFREAALRLNRKAGLYRDDLSSITFLNDVMFRSTIDIPANVEVGKYEVTVYLFRGGAMLHSMSQPLNISKAGFEQLMYGLAQKNGLVYGLLSVLLAVSTGWLAAVVFRKN